MIWQFLVWLLRAHERKFTSCFFRDNFVPQLCALESPLHVNLRILRNECRESGAVYSEVNTRWGGEWKLDGWEILERINIRMTPLEWSLMNSVWTFQRLLTVGRVWAADQEGIEKPFILGLHQAGSEEQEDLPFASTANMQSQKVGGCFSSFISFHLCLRRKRNCQNFIKASAIQWTKTPEIWKIQLFADVFSFSTPDRKSHDCTSRL